MHVTFDENGDFDGCYMYDVELGVDVACTINPEFVDSDIDVTILGWLTTTLANDEASSDEELVEHFIKEGPLSRRQALAWVSVRNSYLKDPLGIGDHPEQSYARVK